MLNSFFSSRKKYIYASAFVITILLAARFGGTVLAAFASWGDTSLIHGCVAANGNVTIVGAGGTCGQNETQTTWLKDVDAGGGLVLSRSSSGATLALDTSLFQAFQVDPTDAQTATSSSYIDMAGGTQSITLDQKSIVQVDAHANAYIDPFATSTFDDLTSNDNDLTNNNGVTEVTTGLPFAQSSLASDFERSSIQYLSISDGSQTGLDITGDLTFESWVNIESIPSDGGLVDGYYLVSKRGTDGNRGWRVGIYNDSGTKKIFWTNSSDGSNETTKEVSWDFSTSTWYHIAVVYDSSAGEAEFYVNGSKQGTTQTGLPTSIYNNTADFQLGAQLGGNSFDGKLDDVRIWNDVRTSTEISDNRSIELTGSESNLIAYYQMEADGENLSYIRTTYDTGGSDTEIGQQGYTGATTDGQSISSGGVAVLDSGTYTIAVQKKVGVNGATATYNNPGMSIVVTPTQ